MEDWIYCGTLFFPDLLNGIRMGKFSSQETNEITDFLSRAYIRLNAWFQWFNTAQSGESVFMRTMMCMDVSHNLFHLW